MLGVPYSNLGSKTFWPYSVIATKGGDIMATPSKRPTVWVVKVGHRKGVKGIFKDYREY